MIPCIPSWSRSTCSAERLRCSIKPLGLQISKYGPSCVLMAACSCGCRVVNQILESDAMSRLPYTYNASPLKHHVLEEDMIAGADQANVSMDSQSGSYIVKYGSNMSTIVSVCSVPEIYAHLNQWHKSFTLSHALSCTSNKTLRQSQNQYQQLDSELTMIQPTTAYR